MIFVIARALGRTVAELEAAMSSREFSEWLAFYQFEAEEKERIAKEIRENNANR